MEATFWLCKSLKDTFYVLDADMDEDLWVARNLIQATNIGNRTICPECGCNPAMKNNDLCHKCESEAQQLFVYEPEFSL